MAGSHRCILRPKNEAAKGDLVTSVKLQQKLKDLSFLCGGGRVSERRESRLNPPD